MINEFILKGRDNLGSQAVVENILTAKFQDALTSQGSQTVQRNMTQFELLFSSFMFIMKMILSISNIGKKASAIKVGSIKLEQGIAEGQRLTLFGQFFYDKINRELRVSNPSYLMKEKTDLINRIHWRCFNYSKYILTLTILFAVSAVFLGKRLKRWVLYQIRRKRELARYAMIDILAKVSRIKVDSLRCLMCKQRQCNVIMKPCLHMVICSDCQKVENIKEQCPKCGTAIEHSIKLYAVN